MEVLNYLKEYNENSTKLFSAISELALSKVFELKPDLSKYDLKKEFIELYESGETFVQVFFYDHTSDIYNGNRTTMCISLQDATTFKDEIITYNLQLSNAQTLAIQEAKTVTRLDTQTYLYTNRVAQNIGFTNFSQSVRNKQNEENIEQ
jgi:hypothetical protein